MSQFLGKLFDVFKNSTTKKEKKHCLSSWVNLVTIKGKYSLGKILIARLV